ncbi:MAG: hypothetical protein ISN28_08750 [Ectothiorhodospiraceae bacterium AqS1]|nr:hypothetical protein [Ectothiorhodospiraceae bacterium AqS1]
MASGDTGCSGCLGIVLLLVLLVTVPPVGIALLAFRSDDDAGGGQTRPAIPYEAAPKPNSQVAFGSSGQGASKRASSRESQGANGGAANDSGCSGCAGIILLLFLVAFLIG